MPDLNQPYPRHWVDHKAQHEAFLRTSRRDEILMIAATVFVMVSTAGLVAWKLTHPLVCK